MKLLSRILIVTLLSFLLLGCTTATSTDDKAFSDISNSWAKEYIKTLTDAGAINGYTDNTFRPDKTISSAEFVKIVASYKGVSTKAQYASHWAADYMEGALNAGYYDWDEIEPYGKTYDEPITRQLAVKIMMNAFLPDKTGKWSISNNIKDFDTMNGRYYNSTLAAYESGLVEGYPDGGFHPLSNLTRAEACKLICTAITLSGSTPEPDKPTSTEPTEPQVKATIANGVSNNGWLQVIGTQLCNEKGEPIILHGMSSHGLQWHPQFATEKAIKSTADYGANIFRAAMYTQEGGYIKDKSILDAVYTAVDGAIANDMYVIIDWHILSDGNPQTHQDEAKKFFDEISLKYKGIPNVIYEVCNEPNGYVTWKNNVKPYAEKMIKTIRANEPKAIILVGSTTWSQDVDIAADDHINEPNIMYTCHFYAGTHGDELRNKISTALSKGAPIFISEWGTSTATGDGGVYVDLAKVWLEFLDKNNLSWCNWSLCDYHETSAALKEGTNVEDGISEDELTPSGAFVFERFK